MKRLIDCGTQCMPIRVCAAHFFCGRSMTLITMALPILKFLVGRHVRIRMVIHGGSGNEYLRNLNVYGLRLENLSLVLPGGGFGPSRFNAWLEERRAIEERDAHATNVAIPNAEIPQIPMDVTAVENQGRSDPPAVTAFSRR